MINKKNAVTCFCLVCAFTLSSFGAVPGYDNNIAHWKMNDNIADGQSDDRKIEDFGPKGNHGLLYDVGEAPGQHTAAHSIVGKINKALTFDGIDDHIIIEDVKYLDKHLWTKHASNPLISSTHNAFGSIWEDGGTYYLFYTNLYDAYVRTSTDGITWGAATKILDREAGAWDDRIQVTNVWKEDGTWYMLYRGKQAITENPPAWSHAIGLASSSSPTSGWEKYGYIKYIVGPNCVLHWNCNDNAANVNVLDTSGNSFTGTFESGQSSSNTEDNTIEAGKINRSLRLTRADEEKIYKDYEQSLEFGGDFTIAGWFKWNDNTLSSGLLQFGTAADDYSKAAYYLRYSVGHLYFAIGGDNSDYEFASILTTPTNDTWYFIVAGVEGTDLFWSINGATKTTQAISTITGRYTNAASKLRLGYTACGYFDGEVDNLMLFNKALMNREIAGLYGENGAGTESLTGIGNPVLEGTPDTWEATGGNYDPWGLIKIDTNYYMFYNCDDGPRNRCIGLATIPASDLTGEGDPTNWTKDENNPIFKWGRFCPFVFKYADYYYMIVSYTMFDTSSVFHKFEIYRDSNPTFYKNHREKGCYVLELGPEDSWDVSYIDTPSMLTTDITRTAIPTGDARVYYSGSDSSDRWRHGLATFPLSDVEKYEYEPDSDDFTIAMWFKLGAAGIQTLISQSFSATYGYSNFWVRDVDNDIDFAVGDGFGSYTVLEIMSEPSIDEWHFIVAGVEGSELFTSADGQAKTTTPITSGSPAKLNKKILIGAKYGPAGYFKGALDSIMIFDKALSNEEIAWLYNAGDGRDGLTLVPVMKHHYNQMRRR